MAPNENPAGVEPIVVTPASAIRMFQKRVFVACPWQKNVHPVTAFCVSQLLDKRRTSSALNYGDAFVAHTRNSLADHFLKSEFDWLLTVDDDMLVPFGHAEWFRMFTGWSNYPDPFASFNALDRLMSHGKTLVGAVYFGKNPRGIPVFSEGSNQQEADYIRRGPYDICKPTRWVGTGCMLIHRSVFTDIEKKFPNLARGADKKGGQWFTSSEHTAMDWIRRTREMLTTGAMTGEKALRALEMLVTAEAEAKAKSNLGLGEDVQFCVRAKEAGHTPHVDLGLICGHLGHCVYGPNNTRSK